ncbi:Fe-S cluster biogenesis protein NfuA, 4Fe-4S-binding domain [Halobiforma haloterrestris]|uniref:Fe-S cluster biogenesis protein NfuA, 4Fe-4S-binding domain n=1 Tax=Natronobacterium haloterrestre TaxID=148448 RepID=A0A1I1DWH1_NATHA|nr:NifU family protein [Halobiforma haloterrestris]SFB79409.1 Fe-S cluster biogenesis protein NfuA, 4Fe-4S-binding domain [Halobiforma haloterrestris]
MSDSDREDEVRTAVASFLERNFPQIRGHGGDFAVTEVDLEDARVSITLSGACSGCGVSSMTTQAIQQRLPSEVEAVDVVSVSTGFDGLAEGTSRDVPPDVPF